MLDFAQTSCQSHKAFLPYANSLGQWPLKAIDCNLEIFYFTYRVHMYRVKHTTERDQETHISISFIVYWIRFHFFKTSGYCSLPEPMAPLLAGSVLPSLTWCCCYPVLLPGASHLDYIDFASVHL